MIVVTLILINTSGTSGNATNKDKRVINLAIVVKKIVIDKDNSRIVKYEYIVRAEGFALMPPRAGAMEIPLSYSMPDMEHIQGCDCW